MGWYYELLPFQKAYALAMKIFEITKKFPKEEKFELTSQIRRSSRSVAANIAEAYKRRKYKDYYTSKLNDSETENCETDVWLKFSRDCKYISVEEYDDLFKDNDEVARLIHYMIVNPAKFCML